MDPEMHLIKQLNIFQSVIKMKALKFDLDIPFWCSFGDYSSLNLKLSYPFPPLTTLFGLIQNSLGKPALHEINENKLKKNLKKKYIEEFNQLNFSILIRNNGELIEDYVNIHKGNRQNERLERQLESLLKEKYSDEDEIKKEFKNLKKLNFYKFLLNNISDEKFINTKSIVNEIDSEILSYIKEFWNKNDYEATKKWLSTQINRQRIINPYYSVYITSNDEKGEYSLESIKSHLENPLRPLYIGESDDIVNIINMSIADIEENTSSNISSVISGMYSNSELIKVPINLKFDKKPYLGLCSIPNGKLDQEIECYTYNGENFVFIK